MLTTMAGMKDFGSTFLNNVIIMFKVCHIQPSDCMQDKHALLQLYLLCMLVGWSKQRIKAKSEGRQKCRETKICRHDLTQYELCVEKR